MAAWDNQGPDYMPLRKSPSTGDNLSNKNNDSVNISDKLFGCEDDNEDADDEDDGFVNYNSSPTNLQRKKRNGQHVKIPEIHISNLGGGSGSKGEGPQRPKKKTK